MKSPRSVRIRFVLSWVCAVLTAAPLLAAGGVVWKSSDTAQLKLEGRVPKTWAIYTVEKKKNLVLVLIGHRYLALDVKAHTVYEIDPKTLTPRGEDFESDEPDAIGRLIPTSAWSDRDVGPAERYLITLGDYGRTLELVLPHPIDFRRGIY